MQVRLFFLFMMTAPIPPGSRKVLANALTVNKEKQISAGSARGDAAQEVPCLSSMKA